MSETIGQRRDRRHLCETRHGFLHVRAAGTGGVPLVLLHFGPYSGLAFKRALPYLAEDRHVLAVDRLGFGMSDPAPGPLDISEHALTTLEALDGLGVGQFDVVGLHTGATEAIELATAHAGRVRRVVLVGVPLFLDEEREALKRRVQHLFEPTEDGSHLIAIWNHWKAQGEGRYPEHRDPGEWVTPAAPGMSRGWKPEYLQSWVLHHLLAGPDWWWTHLGVFDYPLAERLPSVRQPLLVLRTQDDLWFETARVIPLLPPHATYAEVPHLDILAFEIAPEEMARRVHDFLDGRLTAP
jgi:pimeloyl-ACP methyl ester carboxylesterase